jgi:hypothetical protein
MTPDEAETPGDISVVSVRVTPQHAGRIAVYLRPVGYERPRSSGERPGSLSSARSDPFAVRL